MAILVQLLVALGNLMDRNPYFQVEADRHYPNLFAVIVGATAKGRKGTSWGYCERICEAIDPSWLGTDCRALAWRHHAFLLQEDEGLTCCRLQHRSFQNLAEAVGLV